MLSSSTKLKFLLNLFSPVSSHKKRGKDTVQNVSHFVKIKNNEVRIGKTQSTDTYISKKKIVGGRSPNVLTFKTVN